MLVKDFNLFKKKYIKSCKTKSLNIDVLELYSFILENERNDSDYWTMGNGFDEITIILKYFKECSWDELKTDLSNWTIFQLDIFTEAVLTGDYPISNFSDLDLKSIEKRCELFPILINIADKNERNNKVCNDIFLNIYENIDLFVEEMCKSIKALIILKNQSDDQKWINQNKSYNKTLYIEKIEEILKTNKIFTR